MFGLEALANLRFSRGTGGPLDSEEINASLCMLSAKWVLMVWGPPLVHWDSKGTQNPREHAKTVGFSRGTGGPLDNGGTGEPPFRLVISSMLSTVWTGDQTLLTALNWNDSRIESLGQVILVGLRSEWPVKYTSRGEVLSQGTALPCHILIN